MSGIGAPEMRTIFAAFDQEQVGVTYTAAEGGAKYASELIVSRVAMRTHAALPFN